MKSKKNKIKKNILFTFDYELYLGERSGSVEKCIIQPTKSLIKIFDDYQIKNVIFFVDTTYLYRLKNIDAVKTKEDYSKIVDQLQILILKGHYIFPHIHPHWFDAKYSYSSNQWNLSNTRFYRFGNLPLELKETAFEQSIKILEEIIFEIDDEYKIDSFRAGGWCIQPFNDFIPYFKKFNIQNEFSVLRGKRNEINTHHFNFENTPTPSIYSFDDNPLKISNNGNFNEYVISTLKIPRSNSFLSKLLAIILWRINFRGIGDGVGAVTSSNVIEREGKKQTEKLEMVSIELLTHFRLKLYLNNLKKNNYMHFISHPKMLSNYNLYVFKKLLKNLSSSYLLETDFRKMNPND